MRTSSNSAIYKHEPHRAKKVPSEVFLAASLFLMLIWEAGFVFLHAAATAVHWLPVLAVISLVFYLLTSSRSA